MDDCDPYHQMSIAQPLQSRPIRKRNKPTLTCGACTSRKTRCSRDRPKCRQCIRRQTVCNYTDVANMLELLGPEKPRNERSTAPQSESPSQDMFNLLFLRESSLGETSTSRVFNQTAVCDGMSLPTSTRQPGNAHLRAFDGAHGSTESEHPFHNYWTKDGGLAEVVSVLPDRQRALHLVSSYFESVDPLYPMLSRRHIIAEVEQLQDLPYDESHCYSAAKLALHFVVYAAGALSTSDIEADERVKMADLYLSASHQCLCLCSYLGQFSLGTAQVILLIGYLLINTDRISEAWTFSGILVRQAYALGLHRSSGAIIPSDQHNLFRRRIWQALVVQDVSIAYHLHLPPSTVHCMNMHHRLDIMNYESDHDLAYELALWQWATFVQEHVCTPLASEGPITSSSSHKDALIARYREMYDNWKPPFNSHSPRRFEFGDLRLARQLITVSSSFSGVLTVLYLDENAEADVSPDVHGAIDATHEAMSSFFALLRLFPEQMDMWGSYHTRAYAQATRLARILASETQHLSQTSRDPRLMIGKSDLDRYLDVLLTSCGSQKHRNIQDRRYKALKEIINIVRVA